MTVAFAVVGGAPLPASADPRSDVLNAATRCNALAEYRQWLDCYYGAAQPMRDILGLPPAPAGQVRLVPPAGVAPAAPAAAATARPPAGQEDFVARQHMTDYSFDRQSHFTVTLEDGSVWRQIQDDNLTAHWHAAPASYTASVAPSLLGSMMRVSDGHSYRVRRAR